MREFSAGTWSQRLVVAFTTAAAVTATVLGAPVAAHAATSPRDPAVDRANLVRVWQSAGPMVQAAAAQALLGGDAEIETFVASGWQDPQKLDDQTSVQRLMAQGGPAERAAAQQALASPDPAAITTFLKSGWVSPRQTDLRARVDQMLAAGGPTIKDAAQKALDANDPDVLQSFIDTDWKGPWETDQRLRVNQILAAGGPNVKTAAQAALDAGTVDAYTGFIGSGWALATARDQESATIADLTGSAVAAAAEATRQAHAAEEAGQKAAAAAAAAKAAAKTAADLAASAHGNAQVAAAAARQAATAASQAAAAATEAIGAANAASNAAYSAAAAASRAAAAATRAGDAATRAYQATGAAAAKAGDAKSAKDAAQAARDTATDAKTAAQAARDAGNAANLAAGQAVAAANGAATDATDAANAADAAVNASGDASAEAQFAHQQAAVARDNASIAQRAAQASSDFAHIAADAAVTSADAASRASDEATAAAAAAEQAAAAAGTAAADAKLATQHANSATAAASTAAAAVAKAQTVYTAARKVDDARVALAGEQADKGAVAAKDAVIQLAAQTSAASEEAAKRSAATNQLIAEANSDSTPPATVVTDARKVALDLATIGGSWTRQAAVAALGASDDLAIDFVRVQLPQAAAQDDRDKLIALADPDIGTGTAAMKAAAATALAGSDADVAQFLLTGAYPQRITDLRVQVNQVLAAAVSAGNNTVADQAQAALDDGSITTMAAFLTNGQDAALATDERVKVDQILAAAGATTKLKAFAQAALDGPRGLLHHFLVVDQYTAAQYDQQAAQHDAEMAALIAHAQQVVALSVQKANAAQSVAAKARGDAKAAAGYATQATASAGQAATDAKRAQASAAQAQASADRAAASAKTASDAAQRAAASAHDAERSAMWADQSARQAAGSAAQAQADAKRAHDSAIAAHQDATAAIAAAHQAIDAAKAKTQAEQDAARAAMRQQCQAYLKGGVPNGKDSYNKCLDMAAMNSDQRAALAARNAASCQTLFPNHNSKEFNNCLQHTTDPAFDTDQNMIVKQIHDAENRSWWEIAGAVGGVLLITGAVILCVLAEPCGAILLETLAVAGAIFEIAAPVVAPAFVGITAAVTAPAAYLASGAAVVGIGIRAAIEADEVVSEVGSSAVSEWQIVKLRDPVPPCLINSFSANTPVLLAGGTKSEPISEVRRGDKVRSTNPVSGITSDETVIGLITDWDNEFADVGISGPGGRVSIIHATGGHPFWDAEHRRWVTAKNLKIGTPLRTPTGSTSRVASVVVHGGNSRMYNLAVSQSHTYYVIAGATPVLVHNAGCGPNIEEGRFAQTSYSEKFSTEGQFAGRTIDDVAGDLRSGKLLPAGVPINVVVREGNTLISNTRSAQALIRAGIPRSRWNVVDRTGDKLYEKLVSDQLRRNGLSSWGYEFP